MAKNKSNIDNPHDKNFFKALCNHDVARDAMRNYISPDLLVRLNLNEIKFYKTKLVSPQMKEFEADIFYTVPFEDSTALVMFHCEQESNPRRTLPLKVWQYLLLALMEYAENHPKEPLPVPFPVIVYTGERKFKYSTYLFDLFGEYKALAESIFYQGIKLVDVCRMPDEEIKKHQFIGLCEFAFKHKADPNFNACLDIMVPWIEEISRRVNPEYARIVIAYVANAFINGDEALFVERIKAYCSKELGDEAMTIAQQLRNEGLQQGVHGVAKSMLLDKMPIEIICKYTALTLEEIKKIKEEIEGTKH